MKDSWTLGPLTKFSYEEKNIIKKAVKEEMDRYKTYADERYADDKNQSLMVGESEHKIRNEVMRRNTVQHMKNKHIHDFKRKIVEGILKEREKMYTSSPSTQKLDHH
jgi:hypothetical protein